MFLGNHCKFQWFWRDHCKFSMVFEETITIECFLGGLTIAINGFTMVFWCCYHRFQWFSMVLDHWSNDAMVSMDRCGLPWNPESGCTSIPWRFEILIVKHKYKDNIDGNRIKQGWWWQATCPASYFLFPPPPLTFLAPAAHPLVETKETIGSKSVFWMFPKATLLSQKKCFRKFLLLVPFFFA